MTIGRRPPRTDTADDFGVVVFAASAGGQAALLTILRDLPLDFDVPIVVVQHLPAGSTILDIYEKRLPLAFAWVDDRSRLAPRTVLVCPPRACIELLPDGGFGVEPCDGVGDRQIDRLLRSVARSFGHRAIGVVLTGLGEDGAAGARELHLAGGRVLVQSESSASFPDLPRAAVAAGAADLVVPLRDMAQVLTDLVAGTAQPKARSELDAIHAVFGGEGEIATLAGAIDWSRTPLGPALHWPAELRLIARTALASPLPAAIWWGRDLVQVYNEAWRRFLGVSKHPQALGGPAAVTWREVWDDIGPMVEQVLEAGVAIHREDFRFVIDRHGFAEEVFATFALSPIRDARGAVVGILNTCWETTQKVVAERRLTVLRTLATRMSGAGTPQQACEHAASALAADPLDLPFALMYLFDAGRLQATLAGAVGVEAGTDAAPRALELVAARDLWALQRLLDDVPTGAPAEVLLEDLARRVPQLPSLLGMTAPRSALVVPLRSTDDQSPIGALVTGLGPHRPLDDDYRRFVGLVGQHIGAAIAEARAGLLERERLERLAEVDRAKTEFFANVSHEFRTPLSLLLSPLEDLLRRRDELPTGSAEEIDVAARHARRLLRLVDSLLDFSQIEERRQRAVMRPTDLAALTQDVASAFRSAIERAGLALRVECEQDLPPVPVDREMWEKILSNLLSNALKFTFAGEIVVSLHALRMHVELVVADTGVGIPKHEIPNVFKRFHRVRGAKARTIEGSGIGLAIVQDLVTRLGGQLQVRSREGRGTEFTVWLPLKTLRGTSDAAAPGELEADATGTRVAAALADEAEAWVGEPATREMVDEMLGPPKAKHLRIAPGARILVADDNADLRDYLKRLLGAYWTVTAVADGAQALEEARRRKPDLILADVMMPNLDGFALLRAIRADEALKRVPVVFLTARAGEDTAIEGLVAGADDYLAKPFSARELIARVGGQIALARTRRRTEELNAFLVRFSDTVRGFVDVDEVPQVACRMLHEHLGAERAYWAEVDWATREYVVMGGAHSPGVSAIAGRYPFDAWEPFSSAHGERRSYVVDDTQADPRLSEAIKAGLAQMQVGAHLSSPVFVNGGLRCVLALNQGAPRHWTDDEIALVEGVAGRCWAEVERARAEAALRESESRRTFLLELSDALRPLADPVAIQATAARLLRERFDAGWCYYGEHDETGQVATVLADDRRDGLPSLAGRHDVSDIPEYLAALRANRVFNIPDMATCDVFTPRVIDRYTGIGVRAMLGAALDKGSGPMPALLLVDTIRRVWPQEAVELISEVAERTWAAVERARAEAALRASEAHLRAVLEQAGRISASSK